MEKRGELVHQADVDDLIRRSSASRSRGCRAYLRGARLPGDLVTRRNIRRAVFRLRKQLAAIGERMADEAGRAALGSWQS